VLGSNEAIGLLDRIECVEGNKVSSTKDVSQFLASLLF
jgi:hypothetical protein